MSVSWCFLGSAVLPCIHDGLCAFGGTVRVGHVRWFQRDSTGVEKRCEGFFPFEIGLYSTCLGAYIVLGITPPCAGSILGESQEVGRRGRDVVDG